MAVQRLLGKSRTLTWTRAIAWVSYQERLEQYFTVNNIKGVGDEESPQTNGKWPFS